MTIFNPAMDLDAFSVAARNRFGVGNRLWGAEVEFMLHPRCRSGCLHVAPATLQFLAQWEHKRARDPRVPVAVKEVLNGRVETNHSPTTTVSALLADIAHGLECATTLAGEMGYIASGVPVVDIPADSYMDYVYPDPRYRAAIEQLGVERSLAALRVSGFQPHAGCESLEEALLVYQALRVALPQFRELAEQLVPRSGERIELCTQWATPELFAAPELPNMEALYAHAREFGWIGSIKAWWSELRINFDKGTVELRMLPGTIDIDVITQFFQLFEQVVNQARKQML